MADRCRGHILVVIRVVHTAEHGEELLGDILAGAHGRLSVAQVRALVHVPILDTVYGEVIVGHIEALAVLLEVRVTGRGVNAMPALELFQVSEITLGGKVLGLAEAQVSGSLARFLDLLAVRARVIRMILPLTVLVSQYLLEGEAGHGLDVQLQGNFRLKPFVEAVVVAQVRVGHHVVIQGLVRPYVISRLAVRIIRRACRIVTHGLLEVRELIVTSCLAVIYRRTYLQPIVEELKAGVDTSAKVLTAIVDGDTLVFLVEERGIDLRLLGTQLQGKVMLLREVVLVDHLVPPVHVRSVIRTDTVLSVLASAQHLGGVIVLLLRKLRAIGQFHFAIRIRSALRSDQDHTGSGTRTVDSAGRTILQHVDRLDILLRKRADIATGEAVDNDQGRLTGVNGCHTAQLEGSFSVGTTQVVHHQTTDLSLQGRRDIRSAHTHHQVVCLDRGDGTRHLLLVHRAVTYHDYLVQFLRVLLQGHADQTATTYRHLFRNVADIRHLEDSVCGHILQYNYATHVGHTTVGRSFHQHVRTDQLAHQIRNFHRDCLTFLSNRFHLQAVVRSRLNRS